jgi:hypothetical protein
MKRIKPPSTPGLKIELKVMDRGLKQTRNPADKGARPAIMAYGSEGRGKTSRLRQEFSSYIDSYWSINSHRHNSNPRLSSCNSEAGLHAERPGGSASNGDWCSTSSSGSSCPATRVLLQSQKPIVREDYEDSAATPVKSNSTGDTRLWELWKVSKVSLNLTKQLLSIQTGNGLLPTHSS